MNIRKLASVSILTLFNALTAAEAPIDKLEELTPDEVEPRSRTPRSPAETLESTNTGNREERVAAMQTGQVVPEGAVITWGARPPTLAQRTSHCLGDVGRFLYKHNRVITTVALVTGACAITWGATTIIYEDEHNHQPAKLSGECLSALKDTFNGTIYLTKDVALHLAETGNEIFQYFCGFARSDMGNVLCCDSKGGPVVPSSPWSMSINIIGHAWDCYAAVEESWQRFLGYER